MKLLNRGESVNKMIFRFFWCRIVFLKGKDLFLLASREAHDPCVARGIEIGENVQREHLLSWRFVLSRDPIRLAIRLSCALSVVSMDGRSEGTWSLFRNQQFRRSRVYIFRVIWSFPDVQTVSDGCLFFLERTSKNSKSANGFEMEARSLLLIACLVSAFSCFFLFHPIGTNAWR